MYEAKYLKTKDLYYTREEGKTLNILLKNQEKITTRDDIAQSVWGIRWLEKYSDWQIDRLIYLVRKKLSPSYKIKTLRNSGYILFKKTVAIPDLKQKRVEGTLPTESYLEYMNNPRNKRKVYKDLFASLKNKNLSKQLPRKTKSILAVNSYSFDNVDSLNKYLKGKSLSPEVYFTNFDERALKLHRERIRELKLSNFHTNYDDIRDTKFASKLFDLVINDFRLNFNTNDLQNKKALKNMQKVLKHSGRILLSVVIDPRFESKRFGDDQEKAPINKDKPWIFKAEEGLVRNCFTLPYYKRLFKNSGLEVIKEFDIENGKKWYPPYRRFILKKVKA